MVKEYTLDCARLTERDSAHEYLAQVFAFPPYYGRNLDGLYDCLSELGPCRIQLIGAQALRQWGGYGGRILDALEAAAGDNPNIQLVYSVDYPEE